MSESKYKIIGTVTSPTSDEYLTVGEVKTNCVRYGVNKRVTTFNRTLVRKKTKCVSHTPQGKKVVSTEDGVCFGRGRCPRDEIPVKVVRRPCNEFDGNEL